MKRPLLIALIGLMLLPVPASAERVGRRLDAIQSGRLYDPVLTPQMNPSFHFQPNAEAETPSAPPAPEARDQCRPDFPKHNSGSISRCGLNSTKNEGRPGPGATWQGGRKPHGPNSLEGREHSPGPQTMTALEAKSIAPNLPTS